MPGVGSKFIEAHRGVLAELLDLALAQQRNGAIDATGAGAIAGVVSEERGRAADAGNDEVPPLVVDIAKVAAETILVRKDDVPLHAMAKPSFQLIDRRRPWAPIKSGHDAGAAQLLQTLRVVTGKILQHFAGVLPEQRRSGVRAGPLP